MALRTAIVHEWQRVNVELPVSGDVVSDLQALLDTLQTRTAEVHRQLRSANLQIEDLTEMVAKTELKAEELRAAVAKYQASLEEAQRQAAAAANDTADAREVIAQLQTQLQQVQDQAFKTETDLCTRLRQLREELEALEAERARQQLGSKYHRCRQGCKHVHHDASSSSCSYQHNDEEMADQSGGDDLMLVSGGVDGSVITVAAESALSTAMSDDRSDSHQAEPYSPHVAEGPNDDDDSLERSHNGTLMMPELIKSGSVMSLADELAGMTPDAATGVDTHDGAQTVLSSSVCRDEVQKGAILLQEYVWADGKQAADRMAQGEGLRNQAVVMMTAAVDDASPLSACVYGEPRLASDGSKPVAVVSNVYDDHDEKGLVMVLSQGVDTGQTMAKECSHVLVDACQSRDRRLKRADAEEMTALAGDLLAGHFVAPDWVPDTASEHCANCNGNFTFFNRRHHCRPCGRLVCGDCTSSQCLRDLPAQRDAAAATQHLLRAEKVRCCDSCYTVIRTVRARRAAAV